MFEEVLAHAERIKNDNPHDLSNMEVNDEWRQGDLRIRRLPDDYVEKNAKVLQLVENPDTQLAPGTTRGSRHCIRTLDNVKVYRRKDATALDGPILLLGKPNDIVHPEHGDCENIPAGVIGIAYQRAYADELRRVQD